MPSHLAGLRVGADLSITDAGLREHQPGDWRGLVVGEGVCPAAFSELTLAASLRDRWNSRLEGKAFRQTEQFRQAGVVSVCQAVLGCGRGSEMAGLRLPALGSCCQELTSQWVGSWWTLNRCS